MHLLVTRPEPDAIKLAGLLEEHGHESTVTPLMRVSFEAGDHIELDGTAALIATSRNALRALIGNRSLAAARHLPLFVAGKATAQEARRMGFEQILVAPGTAADLVPAISATLEPSAGLLVHLAGEKLAVDIKPELEQLGFRVIRQTVYRTIAADALPASAIEQIKNGEIEGVILMSPRTAGIYTGLVLHHGLGKDARGLVHFCLSEAVAARLAPLGDVPTAICDRPTLEDLLADIDAAAAKWDE